MRGVSVAYMMLSMLEQATEEVSFFRLKVHMYILAVFIKKYNVAAESECHYLVKVKYSCDPAHQESAKRIKVIQAMIYNFLSVDFKIMMRLEQVDIMRKLQRLRIFWRSAVLLINFIYYIFCHHNSSILLHYRKASCHFADLEAGKS